MGGCFSAPQQDAGLESRAQDRNTDTATAPSRRQHRERSRTSLERRNHEAREQLLAGRGEAPIFQRHGTWVANPPMTRKELEHTRRAFWETADTFGGRKEVWDILRAAVHCNDVETARTMITGAELRLLGNGDLIHGCYDSTGFFYRIPESCLCDPSNLLKEDPTPTPENRSTIVEQFPEAQLLNLKIRLSHNSQDLVIKVAMAEKISSVVTKVQSAAGVKRLKLMILGKMLKDDGSQTLADAGWAPGIIVQGLVTQT